MPLVIFFPLRIIYDLTNGGFMKLFHYLLSGALLMNTLIVASASCQFTYSEKKTKISWVAFKTPKKVGVNASFNKISIKTKKAKAKSINDLINGTRFTIDSTSVNSANPERDTKLINYFFTTNSKPLQISGKVLSIKDNVLELELQLNQTKKVVKMNTSLEGKNFQAQASIDVFDFALGDNLRAINEACKDLHENKTWPDVEIKIETEFELKC
jgi:hypothetical protein